MKTISSPLFRCRYRPCVRLLGRKWMGDGGSERYIDRRGDAGSTGRRGKPL